MILLFRVIAAAAAFSFIVGVGHAQDKAADKVKVGLITTLSGPPAVIGQQQRNGFQLALKELGNKLGGRDVDLQVQDDELKPDVAVSKVKAFVERDKVDFVVGPVFSNIHISTLWHARQRAFRQSPLPLDKTDPVFR
jgi:branched-chain amino acid transport system substrate-binding protein